MLVAVKHVRLTSGDSGSQRKSLSGGKKRGRLTEADRQEITVALLARWERETQSLIKQARAGRRPSAGNSQATQASRQRPPQGAQQPHDERSDPTTNGGQAGAGATRDSQKRSPPASVSAGREAESQPGKSASLAARRSAEKVPVPAGKSVARVNPVVASWWAEVNGKPALEVDASKHVLAWWRCPRGKHPRWREYIDVVAQGRGNCPACGPVPVARPKAASRTGTRKRRQLSRQPEPTPYERAFGTSALMRKVNPPEAIRDSWR